MENMLRKTVNAQVKTKNTLVLNAAVFLLATGGLLAGCRQASTFEGSRTSDETGFRMDYTILDREESAELMLSEGDQIQVSISHTAGNVDLTVEQDGEEPIYKGSGQENAEFVLTVSKSGFYRISVTGHQAVGGVSFICIPAKDG